MGKHWWDKQGRKDSERRMEQARAAKEAPKAADPNVSQKVDDIIFYGTGTRPSFQVPLTAQPGRVYWFVEEIVPPKPLAPELTIVEAITGWRRWSVTMFGSELLSNNRTVWKPFEKLAAECKMELASLSLSLFGHPRECQGVRCECGIYAYKNRKDAFTRENAPKEVTHVWGEVYLWGRVVEHEIGWRAQYAYPKSLVNSGGIARQLAARYGVQLIEGDER